MKNRQIHRLLYYITHRLMTLNNFVVGIAALIALSWIWGSLGMMERNYALQQNLNRKEQELRLAKLETRNLELEQNYLKTDEYRELAARELLGKALPGENVLIVPHHSSQKSSGTGSSLASPQKATQHKEPSNLSQWMTFIFPPEK